jgi:transcriptional regulator with XRE-family HTH domain
MPRSTFSKAYAVLIEVLVDARRAAGLTQVELAGRLAKPQSFISKIENKERRVDVVEFCAIAEAIGVEPEALLSRALAGFSRPLSV